MLNQLSGLSSPPLSFTPLTIISWGRRDEDLSALRESAPSAVVRVGPARSSHRAPANRNTVVVLDRCGRLVYQQTLQRGDTSLQSVEAAILSAHLDEPCGPCHLPRHQEEPRRGLEAQVQDKTTSQAKMSRIADAYASHSVANDPTDVADARRDEAVLEGAREDRSDAPAWEEAETPTTTRKPGRQAKRKKGRLEKNKKKKRKQVAEEEPSTTTTGPEECVCTTGDCECGVAADDEIARLIALSEVANEVLSIRDLGYLAVQPRDSSEATFVPSSRVVWPRNHDKSGKRIRAGLEREVEIVREEEELVKYPGVAPDVFPGSEIPRASDDNTNGERGRADLSREIDEGIEIVREDEELVEYADDNVLADAEGRVLGGEENELGRQDGGGVGRDGDESLVSDVGVPGEGRGTRERDEEQEEQAREEEEQDAGEKKKEQKATKDVAKKGKKAEGKIKKAEKKEREEQEKRAREQEKQAREQEERAREQEKQAREQEERAREQKEEEEDETGTIRGLRERLENEEAEARYQEEQAREQEEQARREAGEKKEQKATKDVAKKGKKTEGKIKKAEKKERDFDWVGSDETDSQEFVLQWAEGETDGETIAEGEMAAGREPEPTARFATWREVTIAPTVHDPTSSADSEDQTRRVVVYESGGEDSASDKVEQLHSKVKPWLKGKH